MKKLTLLGGISPDEFLQQYWQKKPLLIRQAIPGMAPPLSRDDLFSLAASDEVESRLITHFSEKWKLSSGPHETLPAATRRDWTLLVQGVNLHNEAADALLRQFRFIPDARLDDLMISYASDTGGVGPHFDSYDVFLLQAHGKRRWRISQQKDLSLKEGLPLKILRDFKPEQEFELEPGDMLYLPPHYAHDGVAIGECMTCSIGFRAPAFQELAEGFLQFMADTIEVDGRYSDPDLKPSSRPAEIPVAMLSRMTDTLQNLRFEGEEIGVFLGEYLSTPKPGVFFRAPQPAPTAAAFEKKILKSGLRLSKRSLMLYSGKHVYINGESFIAGMADRSTLRKLADQRGLSVEDLQSASGDVREALHAWLGDGWLEFDNA